MEKMRSWQPSAMFTTMSRTAPFESAASRTRELPSTSRRQPFVTTTSPGSLTVRLPLRAKWKIRPQVSFRDL